MTRTSTESIASREILLLLLGFLFMYVPTYIAMDKQVWGVVGQGHGPVMLALVLWLVWQRLPAMAQLDAKPNAAEQSLGIALIGVGLCMYVVGRSQNHFGLDSGSQLLVAAGLLLAYGGMAALKVMWFPLMFALTLVPLPGTLVSTLTAPLKWAVSYCAEALVHEAGYPIGRSGVTLTIGQYRLLVADACAGLNSVFALEAIAIFYMSAVNHTNKWRNITLAALILPISFVSNVLRVITLVLVTYYLGDEVGQGFVHEFASIFLFMMATVLTIGIDSALGLFFEEDTRNPRATA
jgi:exosortase B